MLWNFKDEWVGRSSQFKARERLELALPLHEHISVLGETMRHDTLLIYIIQEILTFTVRHAVFYKIDQSNVFRKG